jgi:phage-related protein
VQSADASVASVSDLADAMSNVGPTMAAFGFELEDVNAALAILSTRGIKGSEAGTALKSMFTNIMRGSKESEQALKDLNVQLYDQAGNMRSLPDIVKDLSRAMSGLTEEQRNQYVQTLAGSYGMKAMNTLLAEGTDGWNAMETAVKNAATMQDSAAARTKGFAASMEQLKDSVQTFMIQVGTPLINDVLTPLVKTLTAVMGKLQKVNPSFLKWAIVVAAVVMALGSFLMIVGQVATGISAIVGLAGLVAPLFAGLGGAVAAAAAAIGAALGPVLLIVAAVAALLYLAWKNNFLGLRDLVTQVGYAIESVFAFIKTVVGGFWQFLTGKISWDEFTAIVRGAFGDVQDAMSEIWPNIQAIISNAWNTIKTVIGNALEAVGRILLAGIAKFIAPLVGGMDNAKRIVTDAWENIKAFLANVWETIKTSAAAAWEALKGIISTAIEALRTVIAFVLSGISGDWGKAWEGLKTGIRRVFGEIADTVGKVAGTLRDGLAEKWESIRSGAAEKWEGIRTKITTVVGGIKDFVVGTLGELVTAAAGLFGKILDAISGRGQETGAGGAGLSGLLNVTQLKATITEVVTLIAGMQTSIAEIWLLIQTNTTVVWTTIQTYLLTLTATLLVMFTTWLVTLQTLFGTTWLAILANALTQWEALRAGVVEQTQALYDQVKAILDQLVRDAYDAGVAFGENVAKGIRDSIEEAVEAAMELAAAVDAVMPHSDAKRGPLSNLTASGAALPQTLAQGMQAGAGNLARMAAKLAGAALPTLPTNTAPVGAVPLAQPRTPENWQPAGTSAGPQPQLSAGQTINVTINNPRGEPTENSVLRVLKNLAAVGVLQPIGA